MSFRATLHPSIETALDRQRRKNRVGHPAESVRPDRDGNFRDCCRRETGSKRPRRPWPRRKNIRLLQVSSDETFALHFSLRFLREQDRHVWPCAPTTENAFRLGRLFPRQSDREVLIAPSRLYFDHKP